MMVADVVVIDVEITAEITGAAAAVVEKVELLDVDDAFPAHFRELAANLGEAFADLAAVVFAVIGR